MSDVKQESSNSSNDVADLDWDNVAELAPSLEEVQASEGENNEESEHGSTKDETKDSNVPGEEDNDSNRDLGAESSKDEVKDSDSEEKSSKESGDSDDKNEKSTKELKDETIIEVKADGKKEQVTLKELKENYAGKVKWDKKYSELDRERKEFERSVEELNTNISQVGEKMKAGKVMDALAEVSEYVGIPPYEVKQQLLAEIIPELERLAELSAPERELEYSREKTEYEKSRLQREKEEYQLNQQQKQLQEKIQTIMTENDIDPNEWEEAVSYLDANLPKDETLTAETVKEYVVFNRASNRTASVLSEVNQELLKDDVIVNTLRDVAIRNPEFSDEDLKTIVKQAIDSTTQNQVESTTKKVEEIDKKKNNKSPQEEDLPFKPLLNSQGEEILDWEELS